MKKQIVVIHGGDAFETYEEYFSYLQRKSITLEKLRQKEWKANLAEALGSEYDVIAPQMPNKQNARYAEWKIWFEKIEPLLNDEIILVGHSLGAIFLAKYLSENSFSEKVRATFLVAAPYNTATNHPLVDFNLTHSLQDFAQRAGDIFLYHSTDDAVVPFSNFELYKASLPKAHIRTFNDRGHFNQADFPEITADIRSLS
jgi:uncharacterized protein